MTLRLGDLLVIRGALTETQRDSVLEYQKLTGRPFGELAEKLFGVGQSAVEQAWAEQYASIARRIDPRGERFEEDALRLIDRRQAWQFKLLPVRFDAAELMVCTTQEHLVRSLKFAGWKIQASCYFVLTDPRSLGEALAEHFPMAGMGPDAVSGRGLKIG
jgi:hypothetical protein